jgi:biopolymer transport protein ExbB/TolQ
VSEGMGIGTMKVNEGREPGTILLWLGMCITVPSALLLVYTAMTYPITISIGEEQTVIVRSIAGPLYLTLIGIVIAVIGYLIRSRHRREVEAEKRP